MLNLVSLENMCGHEDQQEPTQEPSLSAQEYFELGVEQYGGTYQESIASFTKAIEADPDNYEYYSMRANAYISIDNVPAATADYARVIEILEGQGAPEGLIEYFTGMWATMQGGTEEDVSQDLTEQGDAIVFIKWSDNSDASEIDESEEVQRIKAESDAFYRSAKEKSDRRAYQEAAEDVAKAIEIYPENISALLHSSNLKAWKGDFQGAIQDLEKAQEVYRKCGELEDVELLETPKSSYHQSILDGEKGILEDENVYLHFKDD